MSARPIHARKHTCPAVGCRSQIPLHQAFCKSHWRLLPAPLRNRIWELWRNDPGSDEHREAIAAAVKALAPKSDLNAKTDLAVGHQRDGATEARP